MNDIPESFQERPLHPSVAHPSTTAVAAAAAAACQKETEARKTCALPIPPSAHPPIHPWFPPQIAISKKWHSRSSVLCSAGACVICVL